MGFWPLCSIKMYVISALFAFMLVKNKLIFSYVMFYIVKLEELTLKQ